MSTRSLHGRLVAVVGALAAAALLTVGCTSTGGSTTTSGNGAAGGTTGSSAPSPAPSVIAPSATASHAPVTLTIWSYAELKNEVAAFQTAFDDLHAQYPWVTVKFVPKKTDADFVKAATAGNAPDIWISPGADSVGKFCHNGTVLDMKPYIEAAKLDVAKTYPASALAYGSYQGKVCALPSLTDAYALYYNKAMFQAAGIASPPKTLSELTADAKKLTKRDAAGNVTVFGFVPRSDYNTNANMYLGVYNGAQFYGKDGKTTFGSDPTWAKLLTWDKDLIDYYGADQVQKFVARYQPHTDDAGNPFVKGVAAMEFDGEWHIGEMAQYAPKMGYGIAPFPVLDGQQSRYGVGFTGGDVVYISAKTKNPSVAFLATEFLTTNTKFLDTDATNMSNIPTTFESLDQWKLKDDPHWKTMVEIAMNPGSYYKTMTAVGDEDESAWGDFTLKWETGKVKNLQDGLGTIAKQIDTMNEQANGS